MSNKSKFKLLILIGCWLPAQNSHGQYCQESSGAGLNVPVWQQIGMIDPWYRSPAFPIWPVYNSYSTVSQSWPPYRCDKWQGLSGFSDTNAIAGNAPLYPPAADVGNSATQIETPPNGAETEILDSLLHAPSPSEDNAAQSNLVVANSEMKIADAYSDSQASPSDVNMEIRNQDEVEAAINRNSADGSTDVEAMNKALEAKESEIAKLNTQVERLEAVIEKTVLQQISEGQSKDQPTDDGEMKKLIEQAVNKVKKDAAWEISQSRKEIQRAIEEAQRTRALADAERTKLLARLKAVEAKLKKAQSSKSTRPKANGKQVPGKKQASGEQMTLAKLADIKRLERAAADGKLNAAAGLDNKTKLGDSNLAMKQQLEREVREIKKRFDEKIRRAEENDDAQQEIVSLKEEMAIQIEKLEARYSSRIEKEIVETLRRDK